MPTSSLKCVENILFLGLFVLVGHLAINMWEKNMIQNEVHNMKFSLFKLKETVNKIGSTYDQLQNDLHDIAEVVDEKPSPPKLKEPQKYLKEHPKYLNEPPKYLKEPEIIRRRDFGTVDNIGQKENQVQAELHVKQYNVKVGTKYSNMDESIDNFATDIKKPYSGKDATTVTRYPLKSTAVTSNISEYKIESIWDKYYAKERDTITNNL